MKLGNYELIWKLAAGDMAELFLAKAIGPGGLEKTLVLERVLPHLAEDPEFVNVFLSGAQRASRLHHSNIVQIFDLGCAGSTCFLAMEYIDGLSLRELMRAALAQHAPLPPVLCAWMIAEACEGLAYAHDFRDPSTRQPRGLVHQDVSLDTILVSRQGTVKVADFGLSRPAGQANRSQPGGVKNELSSMPPEQLHEKPLDRRADVYALGVAFYELLTGHKPYDAKDELSMARAILCEPPVPAAQRRPELPKAVQWILDRALAKDRSKRYPDCYALQADLEAFIRVTHQAVGASQLARFIERVIGSTPEGATPTPAPRAATTVSRAMSAWLTRRCPEAQAGQSKPAEEWVTH